MVIGKPIHSGPVARTKDELIPILYARYYTAPLFMRDTFRQCLADPKEQHLMGDAKCTQQNEADPDLGVSGS